MSATPKLPSAGAQPTELDIAADEPVVPLQAARAVLEAEAKALETLADSLDETFEEAVRQIEAVEGRVIVTGVGKSGHIGRKIAATLASTGTPAFFVHAAEASHGDLGMIGRKDAVLALSNFGGSAELTAIMSYTKRYGVPLIAITARANSQLGRHADVLLLLPEMGEACPLGLAPTTSTTAMLALGDALAVALLKRREFTSEEFKVFHPGGTLGSRLSKVSDIMHGEGAMPLVPLGTPMGEALVEMTAKSFGCTGVVDRTGLLAGIVTDGDLRRHMAVELLSRPVDEVMTKNPRVIDPDALAVAALAMMNGDIDGNRPVTSLFVVDEGGRPLGILHLHDCLRIGAA
ncbi:MAG: KpsF/GutQ family sugar-phosphate isomerase [Pseudomonadota bacterium]